MRGRQRNTKESGRRWFDGDMVIGFQAEILRRSRNIAYNKSIQGMCEDGKRGCKAERAQSCPGRNLTFGTGCAPPDRVLGLIRHSECDGFGGMAAIRALQREVRGRSRAPRNEEFERFRCKRIEKMRGRAPLSPEKENCSRAGFSCRTGSATIIGCRKNGWPPPPT